MSVKKDSLRKLTTTELLRYIKNNNKYVSEACEYSFHILKDERKYVFSEIEIKRIEDLIVEKRNKEESSDKNVSKVVLDSHENKDYPLIYSKNNIIVLSTIFSPLLGGILLYYNLRFLNKMRANKIIALFAYVLITFIIIFCYSYFHSTFIENKVHEIGDSSSYVRWRPTSFSIKLGMKCIINIIGIQYLWKYFFEEDMKYRSKNVMIPFVICLCVYLVLVFLDFSYL